MNLYGMKGLMKIDNFDGCTLEEWIEELQKLSQKHGSQSRLYLEVFEIGHFNPVPEVRFDLKPTKIS